MSLKDIIVIVPVYNEEDSLLRFKKEMNIFIESSNFKVGVLFVNDGSTDNSLRIIQDICTEDNSYQYISLFKNMGLSTAMKAGIDNIQSRYIGYIDADLQTSPSDFELLISHIAENDLVLGYRHDRNDPFIKRISSTIANSVCFPFSYSWCYSASSNC